MTPKQKLVILSLAFSRLHRPNSGMQALLTRPAVLGSPYQRRDSQWSLGRRLLGPLSTWLRTSWRHCQQRQQQLPGPVSRLSLRVQARLEGSSSSGGEATLPRSPSRDQDLTDPYLEAFLRTFMLGMGAGALLEAGHVALQVLAGTFPGASEFSPMLAADHIVAFASWIALYCIECSAILTVRKRLNFDEHAAARELCGMRTLPKRLMPLKMSLFKRLVLAGKGLKRSAARAAAVPGALAVPPAVPAAAVAEVRPPPSAADSAGPPAAEVEAPSTTAPQAPPAPSPRRPAPRNSIAPAPGLLRGHPRSSGSEGGRDSDAHTLPPPLRDHLGQGQRGLGSAAAAKRKKELIDRESYLTNFWYAAALSERVKEAPVKVELCGRELVLFRGRDSRVRCVDNACPHRGAPLSEGWVSTKDGHDCVMCPYHGWSFDEYGGLRDVPAAANKGEWPKRQLLDAYDVEEKGGFVWVFFGSQAMPAEERPPIPYVSELDDPNWKAVYEEIEFGANHFGVFENGIDMAHIHYLHGDSFGNSRKPEIRDMQSVTDPWGVTATFSIHNKPVNAFWALFQVPEVHVSARAYLPSTSMVTFTLGNGLSFTTFVNTVPLSATRSVNRFALVRNMAWDRIGLFNAGVWDGMARNAMLKIQREDKGMVEQLRYNQLPAEYSVRADVPQVAFRKLRQQYVDLGYTIPPETVVPHFARSVSRGCTH